MSEKEYRKGPLRRFLAGDPILKHRRTGTAKNEYKTTRKPESNKERPVTGRTSQEQSDLGYCLECLEGHMMIAKTEMRHALDRYRTAGQITPGVSEKVKIAIEELQGIVEDVRSTKDASPQVKKELEEILDDVRWIRKDYGVGGKGLTVGLGNEEDLNKLQQRISSLQEKAYTLAKQDESCPQCNINAGLSVAFQICEDAEVSVEDIKQEVFDDKITIQEAIDKMKSRVPSFQKELMDEVENLMKEGFDK